MLRVITRLLFVSLPILLFSCTEGLLDHFGNEKCDYTVRLFYHYNRENTSSENVLPAYVKWMDEYLFDEEGILYQVRPLAVDTCEGNFISELDLPPGRYSVISIGNQTSMSEINDARVGITRREDMLLTLRNETKTRAGNGYYDNCGRLFYGYRTFSVEAGNPGRVRVDMVHSHLVIDYTIRWKAPAIAPTDAGKYYVRISNIPSKYALMPQYYFPNGRVSTHNPESCDLYNRVCLEPLHHLPTVYHPESFDPSDCNIVAHRADAIKVNRTLRGQTVTYRLRNAGDVMFSLYKAGESGENDEQLMKDIHLNRFFQDMGHNLDQTLRQEYSIVFEIDADGNVGVFFATGVGEWDEGAGLG